MSINEIVEIILNLTDKYPIFLGFVLIALICFFLYKIFVLKTEEKKRKSEKFNELEVHRKHINEAIINTLQALNAGKPLKQVQGDIFVQGNVKEENKLC